MRGTPAPQTPTDPFLRALDKCQDQISWLARGLWLASVGVALLAGVKAYEVWRGPLAYISPLGGPGIARPGMVDDVNAMDYAKRWLKERWSFRPETYKDMMTEILQCTHPDFTTALKAELEQEERLVRQHKLSAQLTPLTWKVTGRKGKILQVTLTAIRTIYLGKQWDRDDTLEAKLLVVPWVDNGRITGLVVASSPTSPAFTLVGQ